MFENTLPIGTVVALNKSPKKAMIIGFKQVSEKIPDRIFDYAGVIYPVGSIGHGSQFLFDHSDITEIVYEGYKNEEWDEMIQALESEIESNPDIKRKLSEKTAK